MPKTMTLIHDPSEIPAFKSEDEEAQFWATHALGEDYPRMSGEDAAELLPPVDESRRTGKSRPTSLRLGTDLERRLRKLAEVKGTSYQTLLKEFVQERVYEEEKRHKII